MCFRAKTEYVIEQNSKGKMQPRAIGLKEDMQSDVRYEYDCVLSLDKETHGCSVVKDRLGYVEIRDTSENPESPITVQDGEILATLVSEGLSLEEIAKRKVDYYINFILNEKLHKSTKVAQLETRKGIVFTEDLLRTFDYDTLSNIVKFIK